MLPSVPFIIHRLGLRSDRHRNRDKILNKESALSEIKKHPQSIVDPSLLVEFMVYCDVFRNSFGLTDHEMALLANIYSRQKLLEFLDVDPPIRRRK